ncbi:hypothetical protein PHMEG_0009787 [Phytophthora megakarya]|uniref:Uncharacterized protein n=1 Tax=Phytophthora megakarya TaxID=4795 RepID=A0A225WHT2_9STRA|nr:hypothetical protein PHMEG_0009787 [Phytophthora megakarya]
MADAGSRVWNSPTLAYTFRSTCAICRFFRGATARRGSRSIIQKALLASLATVVDMVYYDALMSMAHSY